MNVTSEAVEIAAFPKFEQELGSPVPSRTKFSNTRFSNTRRVVRPDSVS